MGTLVPPGAPHGLPPEDETTNVAMGAPDATLRVHAAAIEITAGPDAGGHARIAKPLFVIGSGASADLRVTDDTVSREHIRLQLTPSGLVLRDEGSTNGTWMGGIRIRDITITSGAQITIGATQLTILIEASTIELALSLRAQFGQAIGCSAAMRHLFATLERAAQSDVTVLVEGESGVGKELIAHGIHVCSPRAHGPFIAVDCGAIPPTLIESELFGHERGAFTGADRAREGVFEQANGGTLFLDEIGELPLDLQPKLLRAIEARQIRPVGGRGAKNVDVRIVAATNRNLADASAKNEFRRDLYYRLAVVRATVPPLRDRRDDILPLAQAFLSRAPGFEHKELPPDLAMMLESYAWPGNVRELRNVIERYTVLGANPAGLFDGSITGGTSSLGGESLAHLPYHEARRVALDRFERTYLPALLERAGNNVSRAAVAAQIGRGSLHRMLHRVRDDKDDE
jgi:transcriptional regulator with PAS, ATPase and Fis domain